MQGIRNRSKEEECISQTVAFVKKHLEDAEAGHNWQHTGRVARLSDYIAKQEMADPFICHMAALLHDVADHKFHDGNEKQALATIEAHLKSTCLHKSRRKPILYILNHVSFSSEPLAGNPSLELQVVQDADRLDAMGAVGIARAFHYGGFKNRDIFDPESFPQMDMSREEYRLHAGSSLNHFFEKLLQLRDQMNTDTGKLLAIEKHEYMKYYLKHFFREWFYPAPVPEDWLKKL